MKTIKSVHTEVERLKSLGYEGLYMYVSVLTERIGNSAVFQFKYRVGDHVVTPSGIRFVMPSEYLSGEEMMVLLETIEKAATQD